MRWLICLALAGCATAPADPRSQLTQAQLDRVEVPLVLAELPTLGVAATAARDQQRAGFEVWRTSDAVSLTVQDGVLVATRGLGQDLMSADVDARQIALGGRGPGAQYPVFHTVLDGENQTVYRTMYCRIISRTPQMVEIIGHVHLTQKIEERCALPDREITNLYWRGRDGVMWKSQQWVGPATGYLSLERLVR